MLSLGIEEFTNEIQTNKLYTAIQNKAEWLIARALV